MHPQPANLVIAIEIKASEQSTDRLREAVSEPIEAALRALGRVSKYLSTTTHGSVSIEVKCTDFTTEQDLAVVAELIDKIQISDHVMVLSRAVELRGPRLVWG